MQPSPAFAMALPYPPLMDHQLPFLDLPPTTQHLPVMDDSDNNLVINNAPSHTIHLMPPTPLRPLTPPPVEQPMDNSLLTHTFYLDDSSHPLVYKNMMSRPQPYRKDRHLRPTPERPLPSPQPIITYPPSPTEPSPPALQYHPPSPEPQPSHALDNTFQQPEHIETTFRRPLPIRNSHRPPPQLEFDPR
jgi:hypothetical protein